MTPKPICSLKQCRSTAWQTNYKLVLQSIQNFKNACYTTYLHHFSFMHIPCACGWHLVSDSPWDGISWLQQWPHTVTFSWRHPSHWHCLHLLTVCRVARQELDNCIHLANQFYTTKRNSTKIHKKTNLQCNTKQSLLSKTGQQTHLQNTADNEMLNRLAHSPVTFHMLRLEDARG